MKGKWWSRLILPFFLWSELIRVQFCFIFIFSFDPSRSELFRPGLAVRVDPVRLLYLLKLKCSFVQCGKYHTSWWNGAAELHISEDLLCGITAAAELLTLWNNGRRATQLGGFTLWHYGRLASYTTQYSVDLLCGTTDAELHNPPVNLLCGTTDAELNNPVWCMHQE